MIYMCFKAYYYIPIKKCLNVEIKWQNLQETQWFQHKVEITKYVRNPLQSQYTCQISMIWINF